LGRASAEARELGYEAPHPGPVLEPPRPPPGATGPVRPRGRGASRSTGTVVAGHGAFLSCLLSCGLDAMRIEPQDGPYRGSPSYDEPTLLEVEVTEPSYKAALDWMQAIEGRHVSYDFWQRGNYTRRLIHQRSQGITPLYVRVSYVDEMRWAYRRLALLGLPIDFVYCGSHCTTGKVLHLCPEDRGFRYDAGWGYIVALFGSKIRGRTWGGCIGHAHLLPEAALDWVVEEAQDAFLQGNISVAPAELIGIDPRAPEPTLGPITDLTGGISLTPEQRTARVLMDLEIPFLDRMPPSSFAAFLKDHKGDLETFQSAFKKLVLTTSSEEEALQCVEQVKYEVAELVKSERSTRLRKAATLLQGALAVGPASLVIAQAPSNPAGWAVAAGAAGATLIELWKQAQAQTNPFSILWKLGVTSPSRVQIKAASTITELPQLPVDRLEPHRAHHWLCPPTCGVALLGVRKSKEA
jgi:hypothetical protein